MSCVKTMRDMTAKLQDGYRKNNAMHVNPKHKRCMKKNLVKNLKIENFPVLIGRVSIESGKEFSCKT